MTEVGLPAFEMDCRDWIVMQPGEHDVPGVEDDAPVLAVLSTLVMDVDLHEATGTITVGLLDDGDELDELAARHVRPGAPAQLLLEHDRQPGTRRYVVPAPGPSDEPRLALLAEFSVAPDATAELGRRVDALMGSFRWQAA